MRQRRLSRAYGLSRVSRIFRALEAWVIEWMTLRELYHLPSGKLIAVERLADDPPPFGADAKIHYEHVAKTSDGHAVIMVSTK